MTAMDTQSTRDARGAGPGGNAIGLPGATLVHHDRGHDYFKYYIKMDPGSEAGMTKAVITKLRAEPVESIRCLPGMQPGRQKAVGVALD